MIRHRMPFAQLLVATVVGITGGLYIYRPFFEPAPTTSEQPKQDVPMTKNNEAK
ncbi:protein PIGBOS1 [Synchiropus splendidus]|uniref:protein PIGBOS1 n=1 Tax=Synchiropus splendidus TaxID=270530 RepID=UPI00237EE4C8|nr:protein PIGBOS1 [Synchiropus splendidus]